MAKLTVKNVGPIREAEFEVKKHTVFIGPQGSGKSTLAKLIAIGGDIKLLPDYSTRQARLLEKYNISSYTNPGSDILFQNSRYDVTYASKVFDFAPNYETDIEIGNVAKKYMLNITDYDRYRNYKMSLFSKNTIEEKIQLLDPVVDDFYNRILTEFVMPFKSSYVPAERFLFPLLSNAVWSLLNDNINLPNSITLFGRLFEESRNTQNSFTIPFLSVQYRRENGQDLIYFQNEKSILLSESASGHQSIIPLLSVIEHQRQQSQQRFIIEEPELNLYPTAQKDLIYALMSGLDPNVEYKDAEWVITTHSPYVLSSFNTLMLAYKVAQKSDELRAEVEKIIPARCWINPDEFAAYYVDKGTVRNIISEETGLIADNELDDVSDDLGDEQDKLFALSRSVSRA